MKRYSYTLDDYKIVMHILRHKCKHIRTFDSMVDKVMRETKWPKEKVEQIVTEMFKD